MPDWITKYWIEWLFGLLAAGLVAAYNRLAKRIKQTKEEQDAIRNGLRALLMRQIAKDCEEASQDGYCPLERKKMINDMYGCYHALGGNDVITSMVMKMMGLPTEPAGERDSHE